MKDFLNLRSDDIKYPKLYIFAFVFACFGALLLIISLILNLKIFGLIAFALLPVWVFILGLSAFMNKIVFIEYVAVEPIRGKLAQAIGLFLMLTGVVLGILAAVLPFMFNLF
jgi:hypothetical protein